MFRFYFVIATSVISFLIFSYRYHKMNKYPDKYTDKDRYDLARMACNCVRKRGRVTTHVFGKEKLPENGGYIMYPNHQGKYDAIAIMLAHDTPCSFVVDSQRSKVKLLNEVTDLVHGERLDKHDIKGQVKSILNISKAVSDGKRYIMFPEGGYGEKVEDNIVHEFLPGAFKAATNSKCPIVPVAIVDSYKVFLKNSLKRVNCQLHFLDPIPYEVYKDMKTIEISEMVHSLIENKIAEVVNEA